MVVNKFDRIFTNKKVLKGIINFLIMILFALILSNIIGGYEEVITYDAFNFIGYIISINILITIGVSTLWVNNLKKVDRIEDI